MKSHFSRLALLLISAGTLCAQDASTTPAPSPAPIDGILQRPNLWETTAADLQPDFKALRLEWTSASQDTARTAARGLTFGGRTLYETLLCFREGKLSEATLIYYNRGDAGDLKDHEFEKLLTAVTTELTTLTGQQPVERGRDTSSAVKAEGRAWVTDTTEYLLEWSATKESRSRGIPFRAEFIRLAIHPKDTAPRAIGSVTPTNTSRAAVKRFVGRDHVERQPDGTVWLKDVPMVDQGQKGYCAVASTERVLRYFGAEVDQHELAQMANSDASQGTSPSAMFNTMKKLTTRFGVKSRVLVEWNESDFLKMVDDYNRATKRGKIAPEVSTSYRDLDSYYEKFQPALLKEVRLKKAADFSRFQRELQRNIDEGVPLLWSVRLGLVPEREIPQAAGGHMRLIIGYDLAKKELIYSDSWGMGHEQKRMAIEDAWTITSALYSLQPIGS